MSADELGRQMGEFFRLLAVEIEQNPALARKLAVPFKQMAVLSQQSSPPRRPRKEKINLPEGFDPFQIYYGQGRLGLQHALEPMEAAVLKDILTKFALDPSRSYMRWRKPERLAEFIIERVKAMSNKGQAFQA